MNNKNSHSGRDLENRPRYELSDIFRLYWKKFREKFNCSTHQLKVINAIINCRTAVLGGHIETCTNPECDHTYIAFNSCRNSHCPKCMGSKRLKWVYNRLKDLLQIPYYHVVFTMPHILNNLALFNRKVIYDLFFKAASYTMKEFSKDPRFLGARLGFFGILHTWSQMLSYHVHLHFIVAGGGLSYDNSKFKRLPYQKKFLFPVKAMSMTMRKRFVELLQKAYDEGKLTFPGKLEFVGISENFEKFCKHLGRESWVINSKPPFAGPEKVVEYISRYVHRVAISNNRIKCIEDGMIKFSYKDYKDRLKNGTPRIKEMTLPCQEFIRRFLYHIIPEGFHKIRYYGFLSSAHRSEQLELIRSLIKDITDKAIQSLDGVKRWIERFERFLFRICPDCGIGKLVYTNVLAFEEPLMSFDSS